MKRLSGERHDVSFWQPNGSAAVRLTNRDAAQGLSLTHQRHWLCTARQYFDADGPVKGPV
jgi:hypothetical protein